MRIGAMLLSLLALLGGCKKPGECGGVTDKTDRRAPKTIESKDISDYRATFCLAGEWSSGRENVFYTFSVKPDDAGALTASEETACVNAPADKTLLAALQEIIDRRRLAERNGEYRTTAGLPPEFWPCTLTVNYGSGEKLTFTCDNDPHAQWAKETYLVFANWFAERGIDELLPPETVTGKVTDVSLTFKDTAAGKSYDYGVWSEPDDEGRRVFFRFADGGKRETPLADERDFFAGIDEIIGRYDLRRYAVRSALYDYERTAEDEKDPFSNDLELTFWFDGDDGEQLFIHTSAPAAIDGLRPLLGELIDYFDARFPEP